MMKQGVLLAVMMATGILAEDTKVVPMSDLLQVGDDLYEDQSINLWLGNDYVEGCCGQIDLSTFTIIEGRSAEIKFTFRSFVGLHFLFSDRLCRTFSKL